TPNGRDRQLVMTRRTRRKHVLEKKDQDVKQKGCSEDDSEKSLTVEVAVGIQVGGQQQDRGARRTRLSDEVNCSMGTLPEAAAQALREQEAGVSRGKQSHDDSRPRNQVEQVVPAQPTRHQPQCANRTMGRQEPCAPDHPRSPVRPREDIKEALRAFKVEYQ